MNKKIVWADGLVVDTEYDYRLREVIFGKDGAPQRCIGKQIKDNTVYQCFETLPEANIVLNCYVIEEEKINNGKDTVRLVKHKHSDDWGLTTTVTMEYYWGHTEAGARSVYNNIVKSWKEKENGKF